MARRGDSRNPARSARAEFDDNFSATGKGGAILVERVLRRLGIRKLLNKHLPARPWEAEYSSQEIAYAALAGLLCGGRGFQCAEGLRSDLLLARIFGLEGRVAEEATLWRAMCEMAGLDFRKLSEAYEASGCRLPSVDIFGDPIRRPAMRRIVAEQPESMSEESRRAMSRTLAAVALACMKAHRVATLDLDGYLPVHGDATELEVDGCCFDAARRNYEGNMSLRHLVVKAGPVFCAEEVMSGASDEGLNLPGLLGRACDDVISKACGNRRVLALLDAAFAEKQVVAELNRLGWLYVICANQWSASLGARAEQLTRNEWARTGPDAARGWVESEVSMLKHQPEDWSEPQTVVVRRWRKSDDLPGLWHYSFLYTNLSPEMVSKSKRKQYGYAQYVWMLYGTKQGQENFFKTPLSDLGGHHPASGRLGATQVFATLVTIAANIAGVISYKVVGKGERGMRLWRFRRDYIDMAGRVLMQAGRVLLVKLAGADVCDRRKRLWLEAFACAGRL
jgi:hypothetical protein